MDHDRFDNMNMERAAARHLSSEGADGAPSIIDQVAQVPTDPGCYLWKDAAGKVVYVGKAKNLRARLRQYVTLSDDREKIPLMMQVVESFDYIVVETEHEALVLERELIAQYHPYFNVDYKDDKSYPYIAITKGDVFPAIKYTRERHRPDTRYFGPYTDSRAARETIDTLRKVMPICTASCSEWKRVRRLLEKNPGDADLIRLICAQKGRPCFDYHVGKGPGVCAGMIDAADYAKNVKRVERFLSGQRRELIGELKADMAEAAADLDFEPAGRIKRRLEVIDGLDDRQQVIFPTNVDIDVIGFYREETIAGACVFVVREGRPQRTCEFILDKGLDVSQEELVDGFVKRYYDETADIPAEVDVACDLADAELLGEWLSSKRGRSCRLHRPQRGEKRRLMEMSERNARHALMRYMMRTGYSDDRTNQAPCYSSRARWRCPPRRCASSASTSRRYTAASRWPRWSCSPTGGRTSPGTAGSRFARSSKRRTTSSRCRRFWGAGTPPIGWPTSASDRVPTCWSSTAASPSSPRRSRSSPSSASTFRFAASPRPTRRCSSPGTTPRSCCRAVRRRSTSSSRFETRRTASPSPSIASCATRP